jgi:hypothetical protein
MGRKLHSCLTLPVRMVVRARVLVVRAAEVAEADKDGSLGRSATTI